MRILVEGPWWSGKWTDITVSTLRQLGHKVDYLYHNRKTLADRARLAGNRLAALAGADASSWPDMARAHLLARVQAFRPELLLSIQGKLDRRTAHNLKQLLPDLKIVFWWGDILTDRARQQIDRAAQFADRILISYRGSLEQLQPLYGKQLQYFPFGTSARFHTATALSAHDQSRFAADVIFVGTCYPERCELVRYLNARLDQPVKVWGRGWRKCSGVHSHGALSLDNCIKAYATAGITLNLHHRETDNGFNMKFYEIPAAGGLQLCDWQPALQDSELGKLTSGCRTPEEFLERIRHLLAHPQEGRQLAAQATTAARTLETYESRFKNLLDTLYEAEKTLTEPDITGEHP